MKKSLQYKLAQLAVIQSSDIEPQDKIEIIKTLVTREELELLMEEKENEE